MAEQNTIDALKTIIKKNWGKSPGKKTHTYIGKFFERTRKENKITVKVEGNHGTYTVSIEVKNNRFGLQLLYRQRRLGSSL